MRSFQHPICLFRVGDYDIIPLDQKTPVGSFAEWWSGKAVHVQLLPRFCAICIGCYAGGLAAGGVRHDCSRERLEAGQGSLHAGWGWQE